MNVHDHITDWQHLPSSFLAGKRAIATTVEGTTIDGFLQSMTTKFSNGSGSMVQLVFEGVFQPVSIRHIYTMPDETFDGYELVLWGWDVIENT